MYCTVLYHAHPCDNTDARPRMASLPHLASRCSSSIAAPKISIDLYFCLAFCDVIYQRCIRSIRQKFLPKRERRSVGIHKTGIAPAGKISVNRYDTRTAYCPLQAQRQFWIPASSRNLFSWSFSSRPACESQESHRQSVTIVDLSSSQL
jgi:hypothetical protein